MTEKLVTVATFAFPHEAHLARTYLESEEIWSFVADEHINRLAPFLLRVMGSIKLQVREEDEARATAALDRIDLSEDLPPDPLDPT